MWVWYRDPSLAGIIVVSRVIGGSVGGCKVYEVIGDGGQDKGGKNLVGEIGESERNRRV